MRLLCQSVPTGVRRARRRPLYRCTVFRGVPALFLEHCERIWSPLRNFVTQYPGMLPATGGYPGYGLQVRRELAASGCEARTAGRLLRRTLVLLLPGGEPPGC
eukprot:3339917-Rhodomonas_salina.1